MMFASSKVINDDIFIQKSYERLSFGTDKLSRFIFLYRKFVNDDIVFYKTHQPSHFLIEKTSTFFFSYRSSCIGDDFCIEKSSYLSVINNVIFVYKSPEKLSTVIFTYGKIVNNNLYV